MKTKRKGDDHAITLTEKAASEVKRIIEEQRAADPTLGKIYCVCASSAADTAAFSTS